MKDSSPIKASHLRRAAHHYTLHSLPFWLAAIGLFGLAMPLSAHAATSISQSYSTSDKLSLGSMVSLQDRSTDQIVAAASSNVDSLLGVVINADTSLLSLSNGQPNQAQVGTSGILQVLVSDINGAVVRGDHITASPISGVGMKATGNVRIIGVAQDNLATTTASQQSYTDKDGTKHSVSLGEIPVLVSVAYYFREPDKTIVPSALQNLANALAGKTVSTLPIIISAAIFIIMLIVVVSIIYAMIRSSIISVGRNPMAQSAVYRDLIQLSSLVLAILAVGLIAIYLVLTRL
jgi:hypothetical protein